MTSVMDDRVAVAVSNRPDPRVDRPGIPYRRSGTSGGADILWRVVLASLLLAGGALLFAFPAWWRSGETRMAAAVMGVWTGRHVVAVPHATVIVLYDRSVPQVAFRLTLECTVGYLVGVVLALSAPIMLVRRLPRLRVVWAVLAASLCLLVTNVVRLAGIGAAVSRWGDAQGLVIGHTYLGSITNLVGTLLAGALFGFIVTFRRWRKSTPALSTPGAGA